MIGKFKDILRPIYAPVMNRAYDLWFGPMRYKYLYHFLKKTRAKKIMEIGTWKGERATKMIETAKKYSEAKDIYYYGFDLFEEITDELYVEEISKMPSTKNEIEKVLRQTGANIILFKGNTTESLPKHIDSLPKMDFVFIDGGHTLATIENDWKYTQKVMDENTVVIFDDYWNDRVDSGAKPIVDAIDRETFDVEVLPRVDSFNNPDHGRLNIQFAKVTKKKV